MHYSGKNLEFLPKSPFISEMVRGRLIVTCGSVRVSSDDLERWDAMDHIFLADLFKYAHTA